MNNITCGEILQDEKLDGKERPWAVKKIRSLLVSESFERLRIENRAERIHNCGSWLKFASCPNGCSKKLVGANFCRDRLCPMCNWRRSLKLQAQIVQVLKEAVTRAKMRFIFLTLTVKNVSGENLCNAITQLQKGFNALMQYGDVDSVTVGYVRNLEVTYNRDTDEYHPHFHVLIGVKPEYFKGSGYISQARWTELWQKAARLDYVPVVNVKTVKAKREGQTVEAAVAETAKYSAKDTDYIYEDNKSLTDKVVLHLAAGLHSRKLIVFGKLFRTVHRELHLQDIESETADLVGSSEQECQCQICKTNLLEELYKWHFGFNNFINTD